MFAFFYLKSRGTERYFAGEIVFGEKPFIYSGQRIPFTFDSETLAPLRKLYPKQTYHQSNCGDRLDGEICYNKLTAYKFIRVEVFQPGLSS